MNEIWISIVAITISCLTLFYTIYVSSKQRVINSSRLKTDLLTKLVTIKILVERHPCHFDLLVSEAHEMRSIYIGMHCDPLNPLYEENKNILHHLGNRVQHIESYKETHDIFLAKQISLYDTLLTLKDSDENLRSNPLQAVS